MHTFASCRGGWARGRGGQRPIQRSRRLFEAPSEACFCTLAHRSHHTSQQLQVLQGEGGLGCDLGEGRGVLLGQGRGGVCAKQWQEPASKNSAAHETDDDVAEQREQWQVVRSRGMSGGAKGSTHSANFEPSSCTKQAVWCSTHDTPGDAVEASCTTPSAASENGYAGKHREKPSDASTGTTAKEAACTVRKTSTATPASSKWPRKYKAGEAPSVRHIRCTDCTTVSRCARHLRKALCWFPPLSAAMPETQWKRTRLLSVFEGRQTVVGAA